MDDPGTLGQARQQLLVPQALRAEVLRWAHDSPRAGHQGPRATLERVRHYFFWPNLSSEVLRHCRHCPACQRGNNRDPPRVPLCPLPIVSTPFERIVMDFIGPLPQTPRGNRFAHIVVDYATCFPEVVPLRGMQASEIAHHLIRLFARVGLLRSILTDRGRPFTSGLMRALCRALGIRQRFTAIFHPQTEGLVERFNQTLKAMIRKVAEDNLGRWDVYLDSLLFAVRETPQASTKLAPFELLYGRRPRGLPDGWATILLSAPRLVTEHITDLQQALETAAALAGQNLEWAQAQQQRTYNTTPAIPKRRPGVGTGTAVPDVAVDAMAGTLSGVAGFWYNHL